MHITDNISESDGRNIHSSGMILNGDNLDEFFGLEKTEEIDLIKGIEELKQKKINLSFNLIKCDLDEVRCSPEYEKFIQEIINYFHNIQINNINYKHY